MATFPRRRAARYARTRSLPYPAALEVRVRSHHVNLDGEHASRSTMRTGALPYPAALDVRLGERQRRLGTEGAPTIPRPHNVHLDPPNRSRSTFPMDVMENVDLDAERASRSTFGVDSLPYPAAVDVRARCAQ